MSESRLAYNSIPPQDFHDQVKINSITGSEIITRDEAKNFMRVDTTADDDLIDDMIESARSYCENFISKDIVAKNRTYYLPYLNDRVNLPFAPVASISSITVEGNAATYEVKGLDNEIIELNQLPAKEVKITYITEGLTASHFKHAILQLVSTYYDNRADFIVMQGVSFVEVPANVKQILSPYKNLFI